MFQEKEISLLKIITYSLISLISIFYILYIGQDLIIPFIISIFISLMLIGMTNMLQKLKLSYGISMFFSVIIFGFVFFVIGNIINNNIQGLISKLPYYQNAITNKFNYLLSGLNMEGKTSIPELLNGINLQSIVKSSFDKIMVVFTNMGLIFFYVLFILLEYKYLDGKLEKVLKDNKKKKNTLSIITNINKNLSSYFILKSIISFITALLSYMVMITFHLDFAIFWAFLIFVLNFIPSVGSIISVSFPILLSIIQFDSIFPMIILSGILISIQIIMGNIIEPKMMGNRLNLSPLAIIIALSFWGSLWGIVGMILSVPLMIILNISLAQIPSTRNFSILISEKGEIDIHK